MTQVLSLTANRAKAQRSL